MAQHQRLFALSCIALALLLVVNECTAAYPLFSDLPVPQRPAKFMSKHEVGRYMNRLKQYYDTMAHLRHWRRDIDLSDEQDAESWQDVLRQYDDLESKR